jgi:hypothetical protein
LRSNTLRFGRVFEEGFDFVAVEVAVVVWIRCDLISTFLKAEKRGMLTLFIVKPPNSRGVARYQAVDVAMESLTSFLKLLLQPAIILVIKEYRVCAVPEGIQATLDRFVEIFYAGDAATVNKLTSFLE